MTTITTAQIKSLEAKIYDKLMENPEMGMGEMGECRDEAPKARKTGQKPPKTAPKLTFEQVIEMQAETYFLN